MISLETVQAHAWALDPQRSNEGVCQYVRGERPWCIVGQIVHDLAPDLFDKLTDDTNNVLVMELSEMFSGYFEWDAVKWLSEAQMAADGNVYQGDISGDMPWNECIQYANKKMGE